MYLNEDSDNHEKLFVLLWLQSDHYTTRPIRYATCQR